MTTGYSSRWSFRQAWQDLNPQPAVLETAALPIELHACIEGWGEARCCPLRPSLDLTLFDNLGDDAGADGATAFADGEAATDFQRHR